MDNHEFSAMQTRLDRLEAKNRMLAWGLFGILATGALILILSAASPPTVQDVVRARAFEVVDVDGNKRGEFCMRPGGGIGIVLSEADGTMRAGISMLADGTPMLYLSDSRGKIRAGICVLDDGEPTMAFSDSAGKSRITLTLLAGGAPMFELSDADDSSLFSAP